MITTDRRNELYEQARRSGRCFDDEYGRLLAAEIQRQTAGLRGAALQILERLNFDTSMPEVQADADDLVEIMQRNGLGG